MGRRNPGVATRPLGRGRLASHARRAVNCSGRTLWWRCRRGCAIYIYIHTCMHIHIHIHVYIIERERDRQIYRDREMICGLTLAPARQPREARCQLLGQNAVVVMPARVRSPFMCIERERGRYIYNMSIVCGCVWM